MTTRYRLDVRSSLTYLREAARECRVEPVEATLRQIVIKLVSFCLVSDPNAFGIARQYYIDMGVPFDAADNFMSWLADQVSRSVRDVVKPHMGEFKGKIAVHLTHTGEMTITLLEPPSDPVQQFKKTLLDDLANGDYYPERVRHAFGVFNE